MCRAEPLRLGIGLRSFFVTMYTALPDGICDNQRPTLSFIRSMAQHHPELDSHEADVSRLGRMSDGQD